jgi:hypothetical protein
MFFVILYDFYYNLIFLFSHKYFFCLPIVIVFSVTDPNSFENATKKWFPELEQVLFIYFIKLN